MASHFAALRELQALTQQQAERALQGREAARYLALLVWAESGAAGDPPDDDRLPAMAGASEKSEIPPTPIGAVPEMPAASGSSADPVTAASIDTRTTPEAQPASPEIRPD